MLGKLLDGRYQVAQVLGRGGFSQTYLARDTRRPGHPICVVKHLKPLRKDARFLRTARRLFTSEAETLEKLGSHDQIPQLLAYFEENQEFYLVQAFIQGQTLLKELPPGQRWSERQVHRLLQEVLSILAFVHSHGVIHRDIKPSNLIRRRQDEQWVLIDFGAVKQIQTQLGATRGPVTDTIAIGTQGYMATEQSKGRPRPNSDLYALGVIGIQALTGLNPLDLPEDPETGEFLWRDQARVSDPLASVLDQMVRYHFKDRYQTATDPLQALQAFAPDRTPARSAASPLYAAALSRVNRPLAQNTAQNTPAALTLQPSGRPRWPGQAAISSAANPSLLRLGTGVGIAAVLALTAGTYYFLRSEREIPWTVSDPGVEQSLPQPVLDSPPPPVGALGKTLARHTDSVWSTDISPDGRTLVSGGADHQIKLWDVSTGQPRRSLVGLSDTVRTVIIHPDGQTVIGSGYRSINCWDLNTGTLLRTLTGHADSVWSLAASPDGQTLASGSTDQTVKLWHLPSGQLRHTLTGHSDWIFTVAISPDGQTLASGSRDHTIKLWRLGTGELLHTLTGHSGPVRSLAISPDGQRLVSGSWDKSIKIWDLRTGARLRTLAGHSDRVVSVAISPEGRTLATGSVDGTIKLWNFSTGALQRTLSGHSDWVLAVKFSPDGQTLISSSWDNTIKVWPTRLGS